MWGSVLRGSPFEGWLEGQNHRPQDYDRMSPKRAPETDGKRPRRRVLEILSPENPDLSRIQGLSWAVCST